MLLADCRILSPAPLVTVARSDKLDIKKHDDVGIQRLSYDDSFLYLFESAPLWL